MEACGIDVYATPRLDLRRIIITQVTIEAG